MATRIRLKRYGAKHNAHYRIAIIDQKKPRDGRPVEEIGYYDPNTDPATVEVKEDRARYWLSTGAQPSDTVRKLFARAGLLEADAPTEAPAEAEPVAEEATEEAAAEPTAEE